MLQYLYFCSRGYYLVCQFVYRRHLSYKAPSISHHLAKFCGDRPRGSQMLPPLQLPPFSVSAFSPDCNLGHRNFYAQIKWPRFLWNIAYCAQLTCGSQYFVLCEAKNIIGLLSIVARTARTLCSLENYVTGATGLIVYTDQNNPRLCCTTESLRLSKFPIVPENPTRVIGFVADDEYFEIMSLRFIGNSKSCRYTHCLLSALAKRRKAFAFGNSSTQNKVI